ncbi:aspartate carbamoyltransferase [Tepidibacter hydrothermalis]|uniref:Aspartate carbamoyltransferase n=1 Tax=Tepidibacter hydrothermalis TaxID=3036126 RepID=A0ABY8EDR0_9FIRM|nr:aspartate carbamoyltransferase [Tepidibacter hydrothermalis]WFD11079.1 aspartate carbamoyltransferase [Tepidibacter hydrothermalis]
MLKGRNLIQPNDFSLQELDSVLSLGEKIIQNPQKYVDVCKGKLLSTLFYEPSTRTRFSFEAAMLRLGGSLVGFSEPGSSSVSKGESLADTIRTVGCYADIIAMRHPKEGSAYLAAKHSNIPVINAGDGGHQHPTQTLTDLLTIKSLKKDLNNLTIGLCGDLKFGRTVHSLVKAMARYQNIKFVFISPSELKIPDYIKEEIEGNYYETSSLEEVIDKVDILYMTRVQRERFINEEEYLRLKDSYILTKDKLKTAKEDMLILHPLPRVNEISTEVDDDPRAVYFEQARYGMFVRMALIMKLLGVDIDA